MNPLQSFVMRFSNGIVAFGILLLFICSLLPAQSRAAAKSVTVPITLDHDRVVIDVYLPLPDGTTKRIRGWVDNGNPDLYLSRRAATLMGLAVTCDDKECWAPAPAAITIGEMQIPLSGIKQVKIPLKPPNAATVMAAGMSAEISIPSTVLRNYDVLIDFPDREFTIGQTGSIKFKGVSAKMIMNAENGLIQIPSQIANKKYNLALDLGSSISFLDCALFDQLAIVHSDWPNMIGALGPANMWGAPDEANWKLMRIDRVAYGPLFLTDVPTVEFSKEAGDWFEKRAGVATIGLMGSQALLNYRVGLDYKHSTAWFDIGRTFKFPDFDVIGLVLRPEDDARFTVIGVVDFDGKPSVPSVQAGDRLAAVGDVPVPDSTMGQVWSMLEGSPRQERKLTIEREGKLFTVAAKVRHFLGDLDEGSSNEQTGRKK
jgi:hypothetical protein